MVISRFGDGRNLIREGKMFIKDESKVASRVSGVKCDRQTDRQTHDGTCAVKNGTLYYDSTMVSPNITFHYHWGPFHLREPSPWWGGGLHRLWKLEERHKFVSGVGSEARPKTYLKHWLLVLTFNWCWSSENSSSIHMIRLRSQTFTTKLHARSFDEVFFFWGETPLTMPGLNTGCTCLWVWRTQAPQCKVRLQSQASSKRFEPAKLPAMTKVSLNIWAENNKSINGPMKRHLGLFLHWA